MTFNRIQILQKQNLIKQQINMMLLENTTTKQYLMTDLLLIGSYRVYDSISKKFSSLTYRLLAKCIFRLIWLRINTMPHLFILYIWLRINTMPHLFILYTMGHVWHALPYLKNPYTRLTYFIPI